MIVGLLSVVMTFLSPPDRAGKNETEEEKVIRAIVQEVERAPSLYAKFDKANDVTAPAKAARKKLAAFRIDEKETFANEQNRRKTNPEKYDKVHPLRAAVFTAIEAAEITQPLMFRSELPATASTPKGKIAILRDQEEIAAAIFKLEQVHADILEADKDRAKEPWKHWQAHYDWARVRLEGNLIFLIEYNYLLGHIRADNLPALGPGHTGWRIAFHAKMTVPEFKAKNLAKDVLKRLKKMETDYAESPWAYFAESERQRNRGMEWEAKKNDTGRGQD